MDVSVSVPLAAGVMVTKLIRKCTRYCYRFNSSNAKTPLRCCSALTCCFPVHCTWLPTAHIEDGLNAKDIFNCVGHMLFVQAITMTIASY